MYYMCAPTSWGWVAVAGTEAGVAAAVLPQPTEEAARAALRDQVADPVSELQPDPMLFCPLLEQLRQYFAGEEVNFCFPLDLASLTPFHRQVLEAVAAVPYGQVRSYKWVAENIRRPKAYRAVGQALRCNPLPLVIPCHRVVSTHGELAGYAWGIEVKQKLLDWENKVLSGGQVLQA